jgi:hypothetical protein
MGKWKELMGNGKVELMVVVEFQRSNGRVVLVDGKLLTK